LRLALFEFDKLIREGLSEQDFDRTRSFLSKYGNLLMKTKRAELGYAIDSLYYNIPDYASYVKDNLGSLTRDDVNRAIHKHLQMDDLRIVIVANNCEGLKKKLLSGEPSPMTYNSPKPRDVLEEDKLVEKWKIDLKPEAVTIVPVRQVFE
jgi:zinc protease